MMSQLLPRTTLALAGILVLACRPASNAGSDASRPDTSSAVQEPMSNPTIRSAGTVRSVNIEGGCWRFDAADGKSYEIEKGSAPSGLLQDGKQATLTFRLRADLMSTCQIGPIVEVVKVE